MKRTTPRCRQAATSIYQIGVAVYVIVEDIFAGHRGRHTVYRISSPGRRPVIIGRELRLRESRRLIVSDVVERTS